MVRIYCYFPLFRLNIDLFMLIPFIYRFINYEVMSDFHLRLKEHRIQYKIDRSVVSKLGHINYQTITKIESGLFESVTAKDLLSYLRVIGFKMLPGEPRIL